METFNTHLMSEQQRDEFIRWLKGRGLDPNDMRPECALVQLPSGDEWNLHMSKFVRDDAGKLTLDYAQNRAVTVPHIEYIERPTPTWVHWVRAAGMVEVEAPPRPKWRLNEGAKR